MGLLESQMYFLLAARREHNRIIFMAVFTDRSSAVPKGARPVASERTRCGVFVGELNKGYIPEPRTVNVRGLDS